MELFDDKLLLFEAYELAHRFNLTRTYDAQYLALAARLDCPFWTIDERLYNTVSTALDNVKLVSNK